MLVLWLALLALVSFATKSGMGEENRRLKRANNALLKALKSLTSESQVGEESEDCKNPPKAKCERCEGKYDYCSGRQFVRTTYPLEDARYSTFFRKCTYPKTYEYVDSCEQSVGDCLRELPKPRCAGDILFTFVEPGTADSRGCMTYGREENVCAMGHCNEAAGKCDEVDYGGAVQCTSLIDEDWTCHECGGNLGSACFAWSGPHRVEGECNGISGCRKLYGDESAIARKSQVGEESEDCTNPPDAKCELCQGRYDYCSGRQFVRTTYPLEDARYSRLFRKCTYPKTYEYIDSCGTEAF